MTRLTRKEFLLCMGSAVAVGLESIGARSVRGSRGQRAADERGERLGRIIREYDAQGIHRAGTDVDTASARWLADEVRAAGLEPSLESIPFNRIDIQESFVEIEGRRVEGVPLFDGAFTGREGVTGELRSFSSGAGIGFSKVPSRGGEVATFRAHRETTRQEALIAVTGGAWWGLPPGLALLNASYHRSFGPPGIQVGSEAWPWLSEAAAAGKNARVVVSVERTPVDIYNVTATLRGRDASLSPLVVMTPRSGWWQCASERGGGIAVWVEMMRCLRESAPERDVHFVASTAHELGHYGLENYLDARRALVKSAVAWIHLGANLGAAVQPGFMLQSSDAEMETLALDAMERFGLTPNRRVAFDELAIGEARHIDRGEGRFISAIGDNGLFHHPDDRWPDAVDVDVVSAFARAFCEMGERLVRA